MAAGCSNEGCQTSLLIIFWQRVQFFYCCRQVGNSGIEKLLVRWLRIKKPLSLLFVIKCWRGKTIFMVKTETDIWAVTEESCELKKCQEQLWWWLQPRPLLSTRSTRGNGVYFKVLTQDKSQQGHWVMTVEKTHYFQYACSKEKGSNKVWSIKLLSTCEVQEI